jgi:5-methylthioadenosine/S-adenosylhomocysteine deaminase
MATRGGARALGADAELGSIEVGKRADVIIVSRAGLHATPGPDPYSALVYATRADDVRTTIVDGQVLVHDGDLARLDRNEIVAKAGEAARTLASRAGIGIGAS